MTTLNKTEISKNLTVVTLWVTTFRGTKKVSKTDLIEGLDLEKVNKKVVKAGSKTLYNPSLLNTADKLKNEVAAKLARVGIRHPTRSGMSFLVENQALENLWPEISLVKDTFDNWVDTQFSDSQYSSDVKDWADANPGESQLILENAYPARYARKEFNFDLKVEGFAGETEGASDLLAKLKAESQERLEGSLEGQLILEVAKAAEATMQKSIDGNNRITRRTLSTAKAISSKLRTLSVMSRMAMPLADYIDREVASATAGSANLTPAQVATTIALYRSLSDVNTIEQMFQSNKLAKSSLLNDIEVVDGVETVETVETVEAVEAVNIVKMQDIVEILDDSEPKIGDKVIVDGVELVMVG